MNHRIGLAAVGVAAGLASVVAVWPGGRPLQAQALSTPSFTAVQAAHGKASVRRGMRVVPRREPRRRRVRAPPQGKRLPAPMGQSSARSPVRRDEPDDAAVGAQQPGRRHVPSTPRLPVTGKRRRRRRLGFAVVRAGDRDAASRRWRTERRTHHGRAHFRRLRRRPIRSIVSTPVTDAHVEHARRRRLADLAPRLRRAGVQPADADHAQNVAELRLAWSWALPNGPNEVTPLVHDGVMFVHGFGDKVQALDAAHRRPAVAVLAAAAQGPRADGQARHRDLRRPALRPDVGRAHGRARREDRQRSCGIRRSRDAEGAATASPADRSSPTAR